MNDNSLDAMLMTDAPDVAPLVSWLLSAERQLPVVLVSVARSRASALVDLGRLLGELDGAAQVRVVEAEAATALRSQFAPARHLYGGAVRVIPAGVSHEAPPRLHVPFGAADSQRVTTAVIEDVRLAQGATVRPISPAFGRLALSLR
ncbi:hypothetical protein LQF12_03430 [Ruania suaedae]|uniref:hypothetical protein n=1 Tax=Ruania suaedae TaxID=2897774 RepID=UPI001E353F97|nr:hypothetical protein [Ruania suaedae]UFU03672.1 hypothetical protein LQF12_03430 [Ruania suaedae]